ncbi:hypothetical protein BJV77DRAFT_118128 [Russula vinacea]|nr:hypothetical protein BJV77DRAFT_118128 [Russula vinacea]
MATLEWRFHFHFRNAYQDRLVGQTNFRKFNQLASSTHFSPGNRPRHSPLLSFPPSRYPAIRGAARRGEFFFLVPTVPWQRRRAPPATNEKQEEEGGMRFTPYHHLPPHLASIHITPFPPVSDWNSAVETMVILAGVHSLGLGRQTKPYCTA